jgi:putative transposase
MRRKYPTDLSDEEWACLKARFPPSKSPGVGRAHSLHDIFDAIFARLEERLPVALAPPRLRTPWSTVSTIISTSSVSTGSVAPYPPSLARGRKEEGGSQPGALRGHLVDSQSVKTVEESAGIKGYDRHKKIGGRKRHLLVDTMGLPLSICVTPANVRD